MFRTVKLAGGPGGEPGPLTRNPLNVIAEGMGISMTASSHGRHLDGGRPS